MVIELSLSIEYVSIQTHKQTSSTCSNNLIQCTRIMFKTNMEAGIESNKLVCGLKWKKSNKVFGLFLLLISVLEILY